ncbi:MAG: hypothetical protein G01um101429_28 [Parcubacteria group bacterium Gr01-1014_29]|nr:MAG: hypothetical protein G01um101429_28 [Parcubacteria group bacterium Gr01-1014_29]
MDVSAIILIVLLVAGFTALFFALRRQKPEDNQSLVLLQNQVQEIARTLDRNMGESHKSMQVQFQQSTKIIQDVTERLTKLDETNRQVVGFADQLKGLQDILRNPKQRGVLGEYYLETVLKNVLPPGSYQMQYGFEDGSLVDAVVFIKDKIVPVDSKFSLENYERILATNDPAERERLEKVFKQDLKTRIDETSKYIKPGENTMDFAFMFIPSEAIYYDLLINKVGAVQVSTQDLIEYAFKEKHVIIVSPTSFLAYLQTVLQGLRALQIEESAKDIQKNVEALKKHLINYDSYVIKMGTQLGTLVGTYNTGYKELKKIDKDIFHIAGGEQSIEPMALEKPSAGEEDL